MPKIVIAPNAFKNAMSADRAAEAIHQGLMKSGLECECILFPVGDGGDGTGDLLTKALGGEMVSTEVHDPLGRKIVSSFGIIKDRNTAVIEVAAASGLHLLKERERNPFRSTTLGTGEIIAEALKMGAKTIVLAAGGSATVDAGCGILSGLGFEFKDSNDKQLLNLPEDLNQLSYIDATNARYPGTHFEMTILCDVKNPLLGPEGSLPVFGSQKGVTKQMMAVLLKGFERLSEVTRIQTGIDVSALRYGGAAGGLAAVLHAYLQARLVPGIDFFLELTGFKKTLTGASLVITGEGSLDQQTLEGKGPYGVAQAARQQGIPVIALAGKVDAQEKLSHVFTSIRSINPEAFDPAEAIANTFVNLVSAGEQLGRELTSFK